MVFALFQYLHVLLCALDGAGAGSKRARGRWYSQPVTTAPPTELANSISLSRVCITWLRLFFFALPRSTSVCMHYGMLLITLFLVWKQRVYYANRFGSPKSIILQDFISLAWRLPIKKHTHTSICTHYVEWTFCSQTCLWLSVSLLRQSKSTHIARQFMIWVWQHAPVLKTSVTRQRLQSDRAVVHSVLWLRLRRQKSTLHIRLDWTIVFIFENNKIVLPHIFVKRVPLFEFVLRSPFFLHGFFEGDFLSFVLF